MTSGTMNVITHEGKVIRSKIYYTRRERRKYFKLFSALEHAASIDISPDVTEYINEKGENARKPRTTESEPQKIIHRPIATYTNIKTYKYD